VIRSVVALTLMTAGVHAVGVRSVAQEPPFYDRIHEVDDTWSFGYLAPVHNTSSFRDRVLNSDNRWNNVAGAWFDFMYGASDDTA
jgi:hypothetical protein